MSIDNVNIFNSLEQSNIKNNKKKNYDDDDYVNMGNTDLSTIKPKKDNENMNNEKNKETTTENKNDHIIKNINKDFLNDDFFDLSIDLKKKENNQVVKIDNKEINEEDINNNISNVKISYYSRPSSSEEEDNININEDENNNINKEENNDNEEIIDENHNPLDDNYEDNFKIDNSIDNKKKRNYIQSDKSINASEINFNFSNSNINKNQSKNIKQSNISNSKNYSNSDSLLEYSQSYNFNQPKKANINSSIPILSVSKSPLPNQSLTSSIRTTTNFNLNENSVYQFLKEINMEKYYNNLNSNGFDDIQLIIEQCKNDKKGITDDNLKKAGIKLPGDRAKIFIRIQDKAKNFNFKIPDSIYHICNNLNNIEKDDYIKKLNNWLTQLKLQEYLIKFISSGYHSVELIYAQMISKFPLNEDILEEIGIKLLGHKKKLMIKLEDEIKNIPSLFNKYNKSKNVNFEKGNEKNCDCKLF